MPFSAGTHVGPYQIVAPIGAGGMGEVYRARDTRLDRTVAIKILTGALAADSDARQRFEHEARAIAALNDPHICTIHDIGRHGDLDYLVLECLEGETLADRLRRPPPLSIDHALAIAIQIGDALTHAHRAGIIHRDLKPGNVMLLRREGASGAPSIKLLDFGLAARAAITRPKALDASLQQTIGASQVATRMAETPVVSGFSGTVQYMAPEQVEGGTGDQRTDIFAFGCVLYEMLAGRKAFEGTNALTVIAAIVSSEPPPIAALQSPASYQSALLDHVMRRCFEKDPERRWQHIADVTGELRWIAEHPASTPTPTPTATSAAATAAATATTAAAERAATQPRWSRGARRAIAATLVLAAVAIAAAVAVGVRAMRTSGTGALGTPALRFEIATTPTDDPSVAVSPDGTQIAFVANRDRVPVLWLRALDTIENRALPGTEGASFPFWSPDGRTLGFFAQGKLKRLDIGGGMPLVLADASNARGGTWNRDGVILFVPGVSAPIMRVATRGGPVDAVTHLNTGSGPAHRSPQFLPDGKRFVFSSTLGTEETNGIYLGSLDKTPPVRLLASETSGRFAAPDKLLTIRQGVLQAYTFNLASGTVQGEPVTIAQGLTGALASGPFAVSDTGVLAYRSAGVAPRRQLVWVDRHGSVLRPIGEPDTDAIASPELSADEQSVVVFSQRTGENDIWIIELARTLARRLTDGPPADAHPLWDPDGQHVVFSSQRFGSGSLAREAINGGKPEPLFTNGEKGQALSFTHDRRYLLLRRDTSNTHADLLAVNMTGDPREIPIAQTQADETEGQFAPDGKWVAFASNESGRPEVFIQSFPDARGRTQISTAGGTQIRWSHDGTHIFYIAPDGKMMAVPIDVNGPSPSAKLPVSLFQTHLAAGINVLGSKPQYAVTRDGRFLLNTAVESASAPIVVSVNWTKQLAK